MEEIWELLDISGTNSLKQAGADPGIWKRRSLKVGSGEGICPKQGHADPGFPSWVGGWACNCCKCNSCAPEAHTSHMHAPRNFLDHERIFAFWWHLAALRPLFLSFQCKTFSAEIQQL